MSWITTICPLCGSPLRHRTPSRCRAFTLIEILLTIIIGSLIAVTALATYQTIVDIRTSIIRRSDQQADIRYAFARLRSDLANFYRSPDPKKMFIEADKDPQNAQQSYRLCFLAVGDPPYKNETSKIKGDLCYIEYRLVTDSNTQNTLLKRFVRSVDESTSVSADPSQITDMAESIQNFTCEFYSNDRWLSRWSAADGVPQLVRITLDTLPANSNALKNPMSRTFSLEPFPKSPMSTPSTITNTPAPIVTK